MLLTEISPSDRLTNIALNIILETAPLIGLWQFYQHPGNSDNARKESQASGGQYRAMNDDYPDNEATPEYADLILATLGDEVQTDQGYERRGFDLPSVRASDLRTFAKALARFVVNEHINGSGQSGTPPKLNGLETLLPMSDSQAIYAVNNSTPLTVQDGNSDAVVAAQQKLKRKLKQIIRMVEGGADALLMSNDMHAFLTTVFEASTDVRRTEFGVDVTTFDRVDIYGLGFPTKGIPVIGQDETPGSITTDTQSVYAIKYGEKSDFTMATNTGLHVNDRGLVGNHWTYNVDMDAQQGRLNDASVARLAGVELV